jgi:hypothetical protein
MALEVEMPGIVEALKASECRQHLNLVDREKSILTAIGRIGRA